MERDWSLDTKPKKTRRKEESTIKLWQFPQCFFTHEYGAVCPKCGYVYPAKERSIEEIKEAKLERIQGIVLDYTTPDDCHSMAELQPTPKRGVTSPGGPGTRPKQEDLLHRED